ncbi:uncharacterized protein LOC114811185 isoform X3 [Ornithorhynchus anatinus]|uniref:uncharacterized protein LOC114811185 isoform X3 n=1 Tax=Ornithorhynchus anatinus TaxID=9258 RepID=UPI0010A8BDDA|nr:uncharacterized protein LOC114811185 isoform X3 [Ornithorhynchus anatinus]
MEPKKPGGGPTEGLSLLEGQTTPGPRPREGLLTPLAGWQPLPLDPPARSRGSCNIGPDWTRPTLSYPVFEVTGG